VDAGCLKSKLSIGVFALALVVCVGHASEAGAETAEGLIRSVSVATGRGSRETKRIIDEALLQIKSELERGGDVTIDGFGSFYVQRVKAHKRRDPRSGKLRQVPAREYPRFRPAEEFKELLRKRNTRGASRKR